MRPARLILASGETFTGKVSQAGVTMGELVFNTGLVGYVEAMTDPSYRGQLLVFTYPLIGNYGFPDVSTWESDRIQVAGVIVSEACAQHSHADAVESLQSVCERFGVPLMTEVDTREVTKRLRDGGVVPACITTEASVPTTWVDINEQHLVQATSITVPRKLRDGDKTVVVIDCGTKQAILRDLQKYPLTVWQVPFDYDIEKIPYDAVLISNGPGDPVRCVETIAIIKKVLAGNKPVFGICLGAQLIANAIGAKTYKLPFGHRAQNHPCMELETGRCYLTSQNHGFCIDESTLPAEWKVMFRHLNDNTVQGIIHKTKPFFAVQFHPEACPGPTDTAFLFDQFYSAITQAEGL